MILLKGSSYLGSIAEVLAMLIVFALILFATYYVTKYLGKTMSGAGIGGNIHVIETVRIAPDKYLQIVEVADKYFLLAISKSEISFISEVEKENLKLKVTDEKLQNKTFKEIFKKKIKK